MGRAEKTRQVILDLKAVREERGLSMQRILDMVLDNGGNISLTTVKRVFAAGSENQSFRYEESIKPIADVLLSVSESIEPVYEPNEVELEALRSLVRLKNSIIAEMQTELDRIHEREAEIKADAQKKIDYLKEESLKKDRLLDERRDFLHRKDRFITFLSVALGLCLTVIIGALIIDKLNPDMGFFWLGDVAARIFDSDGLGSAAGAYRGTFL